MKYLSDYPSYRRAQMRALSHPHDFPSRGDIHIISRNISRELAFYAAAIGQKQGKLPKGDLSAWWAVWSEDDGSTGHVMFARGKEQVRVDVRFLDWSPKLTIETVPECQPQAPRAAPDDGIRHPASQGRNRKRSSVMFRLRNRQSQPTPAKGPPKAATVHALRPANTPRHGDGNGSTPQKYFGEIRTNAGKVKFRTARGYDTRDDAAAAAFREGPEWARECVTYAEVQTHRRAG